MAHDHGQGQSRSVPCQIGGDDDRVDRLRADIPSQSEGDAVSELFKLLGDPTRLRILSTLVEAGELSVGAITEVVETSQTKVSQGLRLLRAAGVVSSRRAGRTILYRLANPQVRLMLDLSLEQSTGASATTDHIGSVDRISIATASRQPLIILDEIEAEPGLGLRGDRSGFNSARQVSIQSRTELASASKRLGRVIEPDQTRRNITIDAGELPRNRGQRLLLGTVELEVFSDAAPCAVMTEIIGTGARSALRKLAGIHCRVVRGGVIHVGDDLHLGREPALALRSA